MKRVLLSVFLVLFAGCSGSGNEVSMTDEQRFDPETITVATGTTVTFTNDSEASHTVTSYETEGEYFSSGGFSSEDEARDSVAEALLDSGETYEVRFEEPGEYPYFCIPHESQGMTGTLVVEE